MKAFWTLPFIISIAYAQVELKVVATDHAGHPVTNLQASDLRIIDDGLPQSITSLRLDQSKIAPTVFILLDLLDLSFQQRGAAVYQLRESLAGAEASAAPHLYILVADGRLYPVQGIGQLDQVLQKVNGVRPLDLRANPVERFKTTYSALDSMSQELARFPGPKQLLWITYGIPSSMRMVEGLMDLKPRLRQLAAQFNRGGIAIYTLDPSLMLGTLSRDGLEVLSAAAGGRTFSSSDLKMALKQMATDTSATYLLEYSPPQARNPQGSFHTVRLTSTRKGVRVFSQQVYLADAVKEPPRVPARVSATQVLPPEPAYTFVGLVHSIKGQSMVLELDDARFVVIDFDRNAKVSLNTGDRASVRSNQYDGHGMVAKSWSLLQPAVETVAAPPEPANAQAAADPVLRQARETAALMLQRLPDFLCKEVVRRFENGVQDTLSSEVSYSGKTGEDYREIRVNGQPTQQSWAELGGDVSTGEFGSLLRSLLANPDSDFQFIQEDRIGGAAAQEYGFHITRAQSDWKILSDYQFILAQYSGRMWFDRSSKRVLRIERTAEGIPSAFPLRSVEGGVNFGEVRLGSLDTFLLPLQAETRVCIRDRQECSRKTIDFSDYHKFTAESKIRQ